MTDIRTSAVKRLAAAAVLGCLVSACGSTPGIQAEKREPIPIPQSALTVQGQPGTFGGTLTVAIDGELSTFNPYYGSDAATREVLSQLYSPLIGLNPVTGKILPQEGLAQSFEANGRKVTIRLRDGLFFSSGKNITADDVLYSFKVALDEDVRAPISDMLRVSGRLPDVKKVDNLTVELEFSESYPAIGYVLSQMPVISAGPDPQALMDKGRFEEALNIDTAPANIASSGPFVVSEVQKGKEIKLKYNPHYWKVDSQSLRLPYLDYIVYRFGLADEEIVKGLETNQINLTSAIDPKRFAGLGEGGATYLTVDLGVGYGTWQLFGQLDHKRSADKAKTGWLLNVNFRQFLSRIVDRDAIVRDVFAGKAKPAYGLVTAANASWNNDGIKKFPFDATAALTGLGADFHVAERDGKPQLLDIVDRVVKFNLYYPKNDEAEAIQQIIVDQLAKAGVPVKAVAVESSKLLSQYIVPGKFELVLWKMDRFGPDPISYMPALMQDGTMHFYMNTPAGTLSSLDFEVTVGRLMRAQQDKVLDAERQKEFNEVQKVWAEGQPVTYIVSENVLVAHDSRLGNFQPVTTVPFATWNSELLFFRR
ncbi:MAG: hypothetical protein IT175_10215 [Acidobacteria bacterium]|nr:hypothetical protein [Acidobacteriota bacterium]